MLAHQASPEIIEQWKITWREYKDKLRPNRKSGREIVDYIARKYPLSQLTDINALRVVTDNVIHNTVHAEKIPHGKSPDPTAFTVRNTGMGKYLYVNQDDSFKGFVIFVGVDLESGFYCVEGSSALWDELCAFQGLDERDIENFYCVAEYISCLEKFPEFDEGLL